MYKIYVFVLVFIGLISCSQKKKNKLPFPESTSTVESFVKGKTFVMDRVGTVSPFSDKMDKEKPYRWFDENKKPDDFAKKYEEERMKFVLQFINDTLARITDDGKTWEANYKVDSNQGEKEKAGLKLRFSYEDKEGNMNFPGMGNEPVIFTSTYFIGGMNDKEIILEAPREFNRSSLVVWMKVK